MIPATVFIVTKNEAARIADCLAAVQGFTRIVVVDSASRDQTAVIARAHGAEVIDFIWNGQYPKKRQWVQDRIDIQTPWILWVDADETATPALKNEIAALLKADPPCDGYFIKSRYQINGKLLRFGLKNSKLVLYRRGAFYFPVIDDLDIPGMGEIEGHYQPLPKDPASVRIGSLREPMIHLAYEDQRAWVFRHEKYARWEAGMNKKRAWPEDPVPWRQEVKNFLRACAWRPQVMFLISYLLFAGFLDGRAGLDFARSRYRYYQLIRDLGR